MGTSKTAIEIDRQSLVMRHALCVSMTSIPPSVSCSIVILLGFNLYGLLFSNGGTCIGYANRFKRLEKACCRRNQTVAV
ncbi:hypothetical protein RHGRI_010198 [Rhododendron griersonianum]|uniref:Uncharacterized protein n=1 Tax=Rhododendron griersonianum TaxID=479676 RepID=A0AAV6KHQ4_9ERIC|nr:hypothetical protein RHGRI_010198 [Rhododendron griersonianum]